jgi:hypothetical protein
MNRYIIYFDFTTVHSKGRFVGRQGQCGIETSATPEQVSNDSEELQTICAKYVYHKKPKWNILMLTITSIIQQP